MAGKMRKEESREGKRRRERGETQQIQMKAVSRLHTVQKARGDTFIFQLVYLDRLPYVCSSLCSWFSLRFTFVLLLPL